jgi:hypothetical protein
VSRDWTALFVERGAPATAEHGLTAGSAETALAFGYDVARAHHAVCIDPNAHQRLPPNPAPLEVRGIVIGEHAVERGRRGLYDKSDAGTLRGLGAGLGALEAAGGLGGAASTEQRSRRPLPAGADHPLPAPLVSVTPLVSTGASAFAGSRLGSGSTGSAGDGALYTASGGSGGGGGGGSGLGDGAARGTTSIGPRSAAALVAASWSAKRAPPPERRARRRSSRCRSRAADPRSTIAGELLGWTLIAS